MVQVGIQGVAGSFHEQAARKYFEQRAQIEIVECKSFTKLFDRLNSESEMMGVVAIENTIAGALLQNHELLRESKMRIVGEEKIRIEHMVAALPGQRVDQIDEIGSHPIALMQCKAWLRNYPEMKMVEKDDTASAAREIARERIEGHAAICSELAAQMYGLEILERGIETNKRNFTRFLVLAPEAQADQFIDRDRIDKASLVFTLAHSSGALSKVLTILTIYDINLTKIQSMPIIGREWEYQFYLDLTFDDYERYCLSLSAIRPLIIDMKVLGEYESCQNPL